MAGGHAKLPVLAEISGSAGRDARAWSLRRDDYEAVAALLGRLSGQEALLVTGDGPAIGAVAVALAGAATAAGRRTALVECELARPRLAAALGLAAAPGLHEYLRHEAEAPQLLQPLVLAGPASAPAPGPLVCIAAGRPTEDAGALLGSDGFRHATARLREAYELVVLAGPALDSGPGGLAAAAAAADIALACVAPAQASGRPGRALRKALRRLPVSAAGAVLVGPQGA